MVGLSFWLLKSFGHGYLGGMTVAKHRYIDARTGRTLCSESHTLQREPSHGLHRIVSAYGSYP